MPQLGVKKKKTQRHRTTSCHLVNIWQTNKHFTELLQPTYTNIHKFRRQKSCIRFVAYTDLHLSSYHERGAGVPGIHTQIPPWINRCEAKCWRAKVKLCKGLRRLDLAGQRCYVYVNKLESQATVTHS